MAAIVLTAALSSLFTAVLVVAVVGWWMRRHYAREEQRLADLVQSRVRSGVLEAGEELLPEFRAEVTAGFLDAVKRLPQAGLMGETARTMARSGADLLGAGLEGLSGRGRRSKP